MRMTRRCAVSLACAASLWAACGTGEKRPQMAPGQPSLPGAQVESASKTKAESARSAPDTAAGAPLPSEEAEPAKPSTAPAPPPAAAPPAGYAEPPSAQDPHARYERASIQLSQAKEQLRVATSQKDCATACRALDSMERAAEQVCEIASSSEERRSCKTAEGDVADARKRVQAACGGCRKSQ
jgi:hypothetical protein